MTQLPENQFIVFNSQTIPLVLDESGQFYVDSTGEEFIISPYRYLKFHGKLWKLIPDEKGFYADVYGTEYGFAESADSTDKIVRAGVGWFSLSPKNPLSDYARGHDFAYSSPVYQSYHLRSEADYYLKLCEEQAPGYQHSIVPELFEFLSRQEGFHFWENVATNN